MTAALLLAGFAASAAPVTFSVNMSEQTALGTFVNGVDQVTARGNFNGWGNTFVLTNSSANTNVFSGTIDVPAGMVEWKYVWWNGSDHWENAIPNRHFKLGTTAVVVPTGWFDNVSPGGATVTIPVTFSVNMGVQILAGNFKPDTDIMEVRGALNGWTSGYTLTPTVADTNIYEGTFDVTGVVGQSSDFKFVYMNSVGTQWELPAIGFSNDKNRSFLIPESGSLVLPTEYYSDASGYTIKAALAFQVNLSVQILQGNFDPATDEVWVRGAEFGWGDPPEGFKLEADAARPGIYTNTWTKNTQIAGAAFEFKYVIWPTDTMTEVWEDGANKSVTFTGTEPTDPQGYHLITLPVSYFNGLMPEDYLTVDTLVTYRVDMNGAQGYTGTPVFDPAVHGVWFNGDSLTNGWDTFGTWGTKPVETQMVDDGTKGDAVAGDKIYTFQTLVPAGKRVRTAYKYGIDSEDNEAVSGSDHVRYIRGTGTYIMPLDKFGTQTVEPEFGDLKIAPGAAGYVNLTWLGGTNTRLQSTTSITGTWADVPGTLGANSYSAATGGTQQYFRLYKP